MNTIKTPYMKSNNPDKLTCEAGGNGDGSRILRLLRLLSAIRDDPAQSLERVLKQFRISRSQFYKDRNALAELGFRFEYRKGAGFSIREDRLAPITGLSLSDRITLLFALEDLCASGDGLLAAKAIEVGRKLAGGLESPFREQLLGCFDNQVTQNAYGVKPAIFEMLSEAIREHRRIRILYYRSGVWQERWRLVDPKRIYMRERNLYLYARTADDCPPAWKAFRLSRIKVVEPTGITFTPNPDEDDGFQEQQKNAFMAFLGSAPKPVTIRFTGDAIPYIKEQRWHCSQKLCEQPDGSLLFTVEVAEPMEVVRWARQFGENASVVELAEEDGNQ